MTSMRVLHVAQPVDAGVPAVVRRLLADAAARGHDTHVACPPDSVLTAAAPALGVAVHAWSAGRDPGPTVPRETVALARVVARVDPDVVVLHSAKAGLAGRLALRGRRATVVVPHAWSFQAATGAVAAAAARWEAWAGRWTDLVVCVSEAELGRGRDVGLRADAVVIDNGVDWRSTTPQEPAAARAALGLTEAPTVVCVGRLARQKGQDVLLRAWPAVLRSVPDARLVLVGDGPDREVLAAAAGPGVTLTGTRDDVPTWLAAADVVAVPSRWEGAALVPLEAMAAARPVVGTAVDGMATVLGDTGTVVPVEDDAALAAALADLLGDPARARDRGAAARHRVQEHFDVRDSLEAWDAALRQVAAVRRR